MIKSILATTLTLALATSVAFGAKRNVLILNVDDLKPTLGCYDDTLAKTPNIDRIAKRGTVMLSNHCQQAVCAASRVSFFTGMRPDSTGIRDLHTHMRDINPNIITMPEYFKNHGYDSIGFGKILHGAKGDDPQSWTHRAEWTPGYPDDGINFTVAKFQTQGVHDVYKEFMSKNKRIKGKALMNALKAKNLYPATEAFDVADNAYPDGKIAESGQKALKQYADSGKPFYMVLGFKKPHLPFNAPKKYWQLYDRSKFKVHPYQEQKEDRPKYAYHTYGELGAYTGYKLGIPVEHDKQIELIHGYYACVSYVDAMIGKVMQTLRETGLDKNTTVVLWGDHGWHLGDHGIWCKHSNFEQATRTPLIISDPDFNQRQRTTSETELLDVFPTLCDLVGLEKPEQLEGKSLVPILKDPSARVKEGAISQYTRYSATGYAMRSGDYRLVYWMDKSVISFSKFNPNKLKAVELYDYNKDPHETRNVATDPEYAGVLKNMEAKMLRYFDSVHDEEKATTMLANIKKHSRKKN
jgi:arylsulfatase A-like enzyme